MRESDEAPLRATVRGSAAVPRTMSPACELRDWFESPPAGDPADPGDTTDVADP